MAAVSSLSLCLSPSSSVTNLRYFATAPWTSHAVVFGGSVLGAVDSEVYACSSATTNTLDLEAGVEPTWYKRDAFGSQPAPPALYDARSLQCVCAHSCTPALLLPVVVLYVCVCCVQGGEPRGGLHSPVVLVSLPFLSLPRPPPPLPPPPLPPFLF
jgi:hypothetical protein